MKILKYNLLIVAFFAIASSVNAQFSDKTGNEITTCECNAPLTYLDVKINNLDRFEKYAYIEVKIYKGERYIASSYLNKNNIKNGSIKINLMHPDNKASRAFSNGAEYGRWEGKDAATSYSNLCDGSTGTFKVKAVVLGWEYAGSDYSIVAEGNELKVKEKKNYKSEEITRTNELSVQGEQ